MIRYVIATHSILANSLVETSKMIIGEINDSRIHCLTMTSEKSMDHLCEEAKLILNFYPEDEFLILVDLFGASPFNSCLSAFRYANYRLITGVNLPMMLELLLSGDDMNLDQLWEHLQAVGHESIKPVFLRAKKS